MRTSRTTRALSALATGVALALFTACGSGTQDDPASSSTQHNGADVSFAQDMLVHHSQALSMVDMTSGRPLNPEVKQLAAEIKDAQSPEIKTFTSWLEEWGEDVPDASGDMGSMGSMKGMEEMPGMMSSDDMTRLENATDDQFQPMWLEMMIEHHEGAVDMAKQQIDRGEYEPTIELAEEISTSQATEVAEMKQLLS